MRDKTSPSKWNDLLRDGIEGYEDQSNKSARASLLVKCSGRIFAFIFSYGRYLIEYRAIVMDFGLRVILNNANVNSLKSVDTAIIDENTKNRRTQTAPGSTIDVFDSHDIRTLFRSISAESNDGERYGKSISGRDGSKLSIPFDFKDIKVVCSNLLLDYKNDDFNSRFKDIDNITEVRDKAMIEKLDANLIDNLEDKKNTLLFLPEIIDWMSQTSFSYTKMGQQFSCLDIKDFHAEKI